MKQRRRSMYLSRDAFERLDFVITSVLFCLLVLIGIPTVAYNLYRSFGG